MVTRRQFLGQSLVGLSLAGLLPGLAQAQEPDSKAVFFDKDAPVLGNPKGDVTIVEWFDYQCTYCKRAHPMTRKLVREDGNIRLVMKDWPVFGPASVYAAQAVLGAAQIGLYEKGLEALMALDGPLDPDLVSETLTAAGLDMKKVAKAVNDNNSKISGLLDRNYAQATAFNFRGTPSYIIGSTIYPGVLDEKMMREAIAKARG